MSEENAHVFVETHTCLSSGIGEFTSLATLHARCIPPASATMGTDLIVSVQIAPRAYAALCLANSMCTLVTPNSLPCSAGVASIPSSTVRV